MAVGGAAVCGAVGRGRVCLVRVLALGEREGERAVHPQVCALLASLRLLAWRCTSGAGACVGAAADLCAVLAGGLECARGGRALASRVEFAGSGSRVAIRSPLVRRVADSLVRSVASSLVR